MNFPSFVIPSSARNLVFSVIPSSARNLVGIKKGCFAKLSMTEILFLIFHKINRGAIINLYDPL